MAIGSIAAGISAGVALAKDIAEFASEADGAITYFRVRSRCRKHYGKVAMAMLDNPGPTVGYRFVQPSKPSSYLIVDWVAWKKGSAPDKPRPYIEKGGLTLLHQLIDMDNAELECDNRLILISSGTYYYSWPGPNGKRSHALPPYLQLSDKSKLLAGSFKTGVIDAGWPNFKPNSAISKF